MSGSSHLPVRVGAGKDENENEKIQTGCQDEVRAAPERRQDNWSENKRR